MSYLTINQAVTSHEKSQMHIKCCTSDVTGMQTINQFLTASKMELGQEPQQSRKCMSARNWICWNQWWNRTFCCWYYSYFWTRGCWRSSTISSVSLPSPPLDWDRSHGSLLPSRQSAYRAHHSIETAVTAVHNELVRNIDSGKVSVLILLDLSSSFDMVDLAASFWTTVWCYRNDSELVRLLLSRPETIIPARRVQQSGPHPVSFSLPQGSVQEFVAYTKDLECLINRSLSLRRRHAADRRRSNCQNQQTIERLQQCIEEVLRWCASS